MLNTTQRPMIRCHWITNWEKCGKKLSPPKFRYPPGTRVEGLTTFERLELTCSVTTSTLKRWYVHPYEYYSLFDDVILFANGTSSYSVHFTFEKTKKYMLQIVMFFP